MTTAETEVAGPPEEELEKIFTAAGVIREKQASFRLLDADNSVWHGMEGDGVHVLTVDGQVGVLDTNAATFVPDDWTEISQRLAARLAETVGARQLPLGDDGATAAVDWATCEIAEDVDQGIRIWADSVPGDDGARYELTLIVTPEGAAHVEEFELVGPGAGAAGAEAPDEGAEADFAEHATAEDITDDTAAEEATEDWQVTGESLGEYYGDTAFEFDGRGYVLDWTTWNPDYADGESHGSWMAGSRADDGAVCDLYVWYQSSTGVTISEVSDRHHVYFDTTIVPMLRDYWTNHPTALTNENEDKHYDLSGWVNDESGHVLEYLSYADPYYYATVVAKTAEDEPQTVRCTLHVQEDDPAKARVTAEESA